VTNTIGGDWHPNSEPDDADAAANRAMHWAGLIHQVESDGGGSGFGFICAAIEHFSRVVMKDEPNGPWARFAEMFISQNEELQ
jgi:hypothetical protein